MEKKVLKKLQLNKETVASLNGEKMSKVRGGTSDGYGCDTTFLYTFAADCDTIMITEHCSEHCPSVACESNTCPFTYWCV